MLKSKSFLCLDLGASSIKVAEFEPNETGSLRLKNYAFASMGQTGANEETREGVVLATLQEVLAQNSFGTTSVNVCAPGLQVFSKFVKLPPSDPGKVSQIIQYEAQQNVPFPLEEVTWDYQILGTAPSGEIEVLLVAIKNEVVESLFRVNEQAGLDLNLVDVSTAGLCNAFRFNYGDSEGCVMLLDIGAKTSNLLFFEGDRIFFRSINIGANSITQDFANESKLKWEEAEKLKIEEGFVSLGGAYEEPSNPNQALISKIARQVMTRLHIQMNQTFQFYRGQQGGSPPTKLYLAGGASLLPYTAQFFAEKLSVPVDYFNPFRNIQIDPEVNLEEIARVAHQFGEVVGLGIRNLAQCPVDLNLMPASHLKQQRFQAKRLWFAGSVLGLLLTILAVGWFFSWVAGKKAEALADLRGKIEPLEKAAGELRTAQDEFFAVTNAWGEYASMIGGRARWAQLLGGLQAVMAHVQTNHGITLPESTTGPTNLPVGVWIEKLDTGLGGGISAAPAARSGFPGEPGSVPGMVPGDDGTGAAAAGKQITMLNVSCRAMNLTRFSPSANIEFIQAFENSFQQSAASNLFQVVTGDPNAGGATTNRIEQVSTTNHTFGFNLIIQLKEPIRIY